jgi:hypothetical protein
MTKKKTKTTCSSASKPAVKKTSPLAATPSEAQRLAATILAVLAGVHSPLAAAAVLAVSLPRYYQLEARALTGLVAALAPRPKGQQPSLENRVKLLEKQLVAAHRQCARQEALVRLTQRTLGLAVAAPPKSTRPERDQAGRKKRRPVVRALKASHALHMQAQAAAPIASADAGESDHTAIQPSLPNRSAEEVPPCSA